MADNDPDMCGICREPLLISSDADEGPSEIIDDVELKCSHHFHWECVMTHAREAGNVAACPLCGQSVLNDHGRFLVDIRNEGGVTGGFDMGEAIVRPRPRRLEC
jgi:hypothetical protein